MGISSARFVQANINMYALTPYCLSDYRFLFYFLILNIIKSQRESECYVPLKHFQGTQLDLKNLIVPLRARFTLFVALWVKFT